MSTSPLIVNTGIKETKRDVQQKLTEKLPEILEMMQEGDAKALQERMKEAFEALKKAIEAGSIAAIDAILTKFNDKTQKMALLQIKDEEGCNVFHWVARGGNVEALKMILNHCSEWDQLQIPCAKGKIPLFYAIEFKQFAMVTHLLENCDPKSTMLAIQLPNKANALHLAVTTSEEIAKYILKKKPELLMQRDENGKNTLMYASNPFSFDKDSNLSAEHVSILQFISAKAPEQLFERDKNGFSEFDHLHVAMKSILESNSSLEAKGRKESCMAVLVKQKLVLLHACSVLQSQQKEKSFNIRLETRHRDEEILLDYQIARQNAAITANEEMILANQCMLGLMSDSEKQLKEKLARLKEEAKELKKNNPAIKKVNGKGIGMKRKVFASIGDVEAPLDNHGFGEAAKRRKL